MEWWRNLIDKDDLLYDPKGFKLIEKNQYDAFHDTDLKEYLDENNIKQLVVTGVMTNLCCETTARSAFIKGYEPFFLVDATACYNELYHKASILNLAQGVCAPLRVEELLCQI